jgi:hypothetical protein|tara:strand:- start:5549 stop:5866 length:318 start_codon:yes stop_codon:yes gene_type:complete
MKEWALLSKDDGLSTYFREHDGKIEYNTVEDVSNLLKHTQAARNKESKSWKGDMHHVASIPQTLYMEWWKEFGSSPMDPENQPRLLKKLQEREFSQLRVKTGRLI